METGIFYAIGAAITWGLVYALDQKLLTVMTPLTILFLNALVAMFLFAPFMLMEANSVRAALNSGKSNLVLLFVTIVLAGLGSFLILTSIKKMDAASASIIEISYPFFVAFFSYLLFKSTPNAYFFVGGVLVFIGSAIIIKFA